jgi:hypothetical protein
MKQSILALLLVVGLHAQQITGGIIGTVTDSSGAAVPQASVEARNVDTNLAVKVLTAPAGSYQIPNLPAGTYRVSISKDGFKTETHTSILVQGDRTTSVPGKLEVGAVATTVEVSATPLLNQVDTTSGYVLDSQTINNTPLATGSFTQLAILSPGLSADFANGTGSNAGFGNQAIWSNGQRDTSNSFAINGVSADNIFDGKTTSQVNSSRFTLNTGQTSAAGGDTQTNTSAYDSAGQAIPTPAPETLQEVRVNAAMYDASQGAKAGAHIEVTTRSGTNEFHGQGYEYLQNTIFNAAPFFRNASTAIAPHDKVPALHYNRFGATVGGPVHKDKLFFFAAYQGIQDIDALNGTKSLTVPLHLTDDRSAQGIINMLQADFGKNVTASQLDPAALKLFQAKIGNNYLIPSPQITNAATAAQLGYDVYLQGPSSFTANQGIADLDYVINSKDRISGKYIYQNNPVQAPFGGGSTLGFPKATQTGSQTGAIDNTTILGPTLTWDQKFGVIRQYNYSATAQPFTATSLGIDAFNFSSFPGISISTSDPTLKKGLSIGPSGNFANTGFYQNMGTASTNLNWVKGRHTMTFGANVQHVQLNVINNTNATPTVSFSDMAALLTGNVTANNTNVFLGATNRYYRADQIGAFAQDNIRLTANLNLNLGVRYDFNGPLSEKYGKLTNFHPNVYQYNSATDTVTNSGLVVAGNNSALGTPGVSDSTLTGRQWGFAPRIGIVWSPPHLKNVVIRTGFGMFYDRGEYFSELSPGAGSGVNGPFGVTVAAPFAQQVIGTSQGTFSQPFLGSTVPPVVTNQTLFAGLIPNAAQLRAAAHSYTFSGYDPGNVLPYTENWSFDLQWQPVNSVQMSLGYVGNHGLHQVLPIPFNQPQIATPQNPINGETSSYGFNVIPTETLHTYDGGNTDLRVPYLGFNSNSALYKAEGVSTYNALQFGLRKRLSQGLQITAAYTWSHTLDMQSGLGLFFNGNDPFNLHNSYATSSYDRTHVAIVQYYYQLPNLASNASVLGKFSNGWALSGVTVFESGQPYDAYDYSGAVGGIYYSQYVEILDPVLPIKPGTTNSQALLQGTTGINLNAPLLNAGAFYVPQVAPGSMGVPCTTVNGSQVCDTFETTFGATGRNTFRGPFQERFDVSLMKETRLNERFTVKFQADTYNLLNHASFDVPSNNLSQYSVSSAGVPTLRSPSPSFGFIQHTLGSPRLMQFSLHLVF